MLGWNTDNVEELRVSTVLTKQRQQRLQGEVHGPSAGLLPRLQHHLLLTHLA